VVEHYLHTVGVAGSKPAARTINPKEFEGLGEFRADSAQYRPLPSQGGGPLTLGVTQPRRARDGRARGGAYGQTWPGPDLLGIKENAE
jgi:hypothetical protein